MHETPPSLPSTPRWTASQLKAIRTTDRSVLVSAAAGSGKTSVLSQRCAELVRPGGCNIDELLVVTFTEAAAGEMRSRIESALVQDVERQLAGGTLAGGAATHLQQQLTRMPRAQISTLHGFCSKLIRQHFHLRGLDPQFTVLEEDMASLMLEETARDLFEERYVQERFCSLVELYGSGFDDAVLGASIHIYYTLRSVVDPAGWRARAIADITEAADKPLAESRFGRAFLAQLNAAVGEAVAAAEHALNAILALGVDAKYADYAQTLVTAAQDIADAIARGDIAESRRIQASLPNQPPIKKGSNHEAALKAALEPAKSPLAGKKASLLRLLSFSESFLREGMRRTVPAAQELLELVSLLEERFAGAKREANALDFSDLEHHAMELLRGQDRMSPSAVALDCHRRYRHVLVDEYQDINEIQDEILRLVSTECLAGQVERTNLFCVGDVKQSIYGFRLADPLRFLARRDNFHEGTWAHGTSIPLNENFRGRAPLLEAINDVFRNLMCSGRTKVIYNEQEALQPGATFPPQEGAFVGAPLELHVIDENQADEEAEALDSAPDMPPADGTLAKAAADEAAELDRSEREARYVSKLIHELMGCSASPQRLVWDRKLERYRPICYGDIVILLRTMSGTANIYVRQLLEQGIPAYAQSRGGFFEATEIRDLLALLDVIDNARQDIPLAAVLRSPLAAIVHPEDCLADIRLYADAQAEHVLFHEAARRYAADARQRWAAPLQALFERLTAWRELSHQRPVDELLWRIYRQTGYLAFCAGLPRGNQRMANLYELHRRARDFGASQRQGLSRFLQMLHDASERGRVGEATAARVGADTVQIMTVHASKGLEFPVVICPDLGRRFNLADCRGAILMERSMGLALEVVDTSRKVRYDSLATKVLAGTLRDASIAEELRVLYVAMTRAKEHLILLGSASAKSLEGWQAQGQNQPLTDEKVLTSSCSLQWLYTLAHGPANGVIALTPVSLSSIPPAPAQEATSADLPLLQAVQQGAALPHADTLPAADVIARLSYCYPQQPWTVIAAAQSVTALSKAEHADHPAPLSADDGDEGLLPIASADSFVPDAGSPLGSDPGVKTAAATHLVADLLPPPPFILGREEAASAADRGIATHAVLQHLDFAPFAGLTAASGVGCLENQIEQMVARHHLTPAQAALVIRDDILWWLATPLGQSLATHQQLLLREIPFYLAIEPPGPATSAAGRLDRIMVRGRIDAVLPLSEGLIILDYKTDRCLPAPGEARFEGYRRQCDFYRQAVTHMAPAGVASVQLVFLSARRIVEA